MPPSTSRGLPARLVRLFTLAVAAAVSAISVVEAMAQGGGTAAGIVVDAQGVLRVEWRGIKVAGHVEDVLKEVKGLNKA